MGALGKHAGVGLGHLHGGTPRLSGSVVCRHRPFANATRSFTVAPMNPFAKLSAALTPADVAAVALLLGAWAVVEIALRPAGAGARSTGEMMARYRAIWFREAAARDNRIVDATLLTGLRAAIAFYISAVLIAIGGAVALIGRADEVQLIATDLAGELSRPRAAWIVKLLLVIAALVMSLLQFMWSHRVFGYCVVLLGAIPADGNTAEGRRIAEMGARLNVLGSRNFNRGLRSAYFALTALAWLVGAWALMGATALTVWILLRREFLSETRRAIAGD
jgi:uncharacterized membrane protein